jgi:hypothetical protein
MKRKRAPACLRGARSAQRAQRQKESSSRGQSEKRHLASAITPDALAHCALFAEIVPSIAARTAMKTNCNSNTNAKTNHCIGNEFQMIEPGTISPMYCISLMIGVHKMSIDGVWRSVL